jgi:hypothetical protein
MASTPLREQFFDRVDDDVWLLQGDAVPTHFGYFEFGVG